jgi:hypothetical protein
MKLPKLEKPERYQGLYVFDFGDHSGVGFTADEVAELLESERYQDGKVYKVHKAYPDGRIELKGVPKETFELETGLFFYASDLPTARHDYQCLVKMAVSHQPPCRAKIHLAGGDEGQPMVALIYPAEFDDEMSFWLQEGQYQTAGLVEGGVGATQAYYDRAPEILERHQLFGVHAFESRTGDELLLGLKRAVQR